MPRMMVPWDVESPRLFDDFRREMNQLVSNFFGGEDGGRGVAGFMPRTNIAETDSGYEVSLDLPGMKPEEVNIELKEGQLWVTGERKCEREEKGKTFHRVERQYGQFRRIIPFDVPVDADKVEAEYKDGVLHVTVPKSETAKPRRIEVKA
jgi:HSP20 family protein